MARTAPPSGAAWGARIVAAAAALAALAGLPLLLRYAGAAPFALQSGGVSEVAVYVLMLSPLLVPVTLVGAFLTWRRYSPARLVVTLLPFAIVAAAAATILAGLRG